MRYLVLLFTFSMSVACAQNTKATKTQEGEYFGAQFDIAEVISQTDLVSKMQISADTLNVQVEGIVEEVCQSKGCWMNIVSGKGGDEQAIFVKFKDYGFFVPKDIAGRTVVMNGKAFKEETPVDELKHYAEDKGASQEEIDAITEPEVELKFMADGVLLKKA